MKIKQGPWAGNHTARYKIGKVWFGFNARTGKAFIGLGNKFLYPPWPFGRQHRDKGPFDK